jgi:hypothetical protein
MHRERTRYAFVSDHDQGHVLVRGMQDCQDYVEGCGKGESSLSGLMKLAELVDRFHLHKCYVHECDVLVECDGECAEGEVPKRPVCDVHLPMWLAIDKVLDDAGYTEDGKSWFLNSVKKGDILKMF